MGHVNGMNEDCEPGLESETDSLYEDTYNWEEEKEYVSTRVECVKTLSQQDLRLSIIGNNIADLYKYAYKCEDQKELLNIMLAVLECRKHRLEAKKYNMDYVGDPYVEDPDVNKMNNLYTYRDMLNKVSDEIPTVSEELRNKILESRRDDEFGDMKYECLTDKLLQSNEKIFEAIRMSYDLNISEKALLKLELKHIECIKHRVEIEQKFLGVVFSENLLTLTDNYNKELNELTPEVQEINDKLKTVRSKGGLLKTMEEERNSMNMTDPFSLMSVDELTELSESVNFGTIGWYLHSALFKANEGMIEQLLSNGDYTVRKETFEVALENVECMKLWIEIEQEWSENLHNQEVMESGYGLDDYVSLLEKLTPKLQAVNKKLSDLVNRLSTEEVEVEEHEVWKDF